MDLNQLARKAGFYKAQVEENPIHPQIVVTSRPYYVSQRGDGGVDLIDFESPQEITSARYFHFDNRQGPILDLDSKEPRARGNDVITILRVYHLIKP